MEKRRRELENAAEEIEQLFADLWQVFPFSRGMRRGYRPEVDVYRTEDPSSLTVVVELPGVDPKKVQVFIGNVSITATVDELAQRAAIAGAQASALSSASAEARQSFGTDSVTQQIDMGFSGDVGIAPTMGHSVPLEGEIISTPVGEDEEELKKRRK